jgi:hypothetical protein
VVAEFGLQAFTAEDREAIWRTWHALDAWPDFGPALARWHWFSFMGTVLPFEIIAYAI